MSDAAERKSKREPGPVALEGLDPTKPFFMALTAEYSDGSVAPDRGEGIETCSETVDECVAVLRELASDHPALEGYIYRCVPVKRVSRGPVRTMSIRSKP